MGPEILASLPITTLSLEFGIFVLEFFKKVQNKIHYAVHGQTAAEVIFNRADAEKEFMGLLTFSGNQPHLKDVVVAKNYLNESEMAQLQRLVSAYLDIAEDMALRQIPMTMQDWETRLNRFIAATAREVLQVEFPAAAARIGAGEPADEGRRRGAAPSARYRRWRWPSSARRSPP